MESLLYFTLSSCRMVEQLEQRNIVSDSTDMVSHTFAHQQQTLAATHAWGSNVRKRATNMQAATISATNIQSDMRFPNSTLCVRSSVGSEQTHNCVFERMPTSEYRSRVRKCINRVCSHVRATTIKLVHLYRMSVWSPVSSVDRLSRCCPRMRPHT